MPICKKCNEPFANWLKIDGRSRNLGHRKFCLKCSLFGEHNTVDLSDINLRCSADRYPETDIRDAVSKARSVIEVLDILNIRMNGRNHTRMSQRIKRLGLNTDHFLGIRANSGEKHVGTKRKIAGEVLSIWEKDLRCKAKRIREAMLESGVANVCSECGLPPVWNGRALTLQIDHVNGNRRDNRMSNIRFLCPNCHSQTDTFGTKNIRPHSSGG